MSKELTEQWLNGTLPAGCYYVLSTEDDTPVACDIDTVCDFMIRDIIAPVPDYEKVKEMSQRIERLEFDNEVLEMAHNEGKEINAELVSKNEQLEKQLDLYKRAIERTDRIEKCLNQEVQIKRLQEQLRIATKALKNAHKFPQTMSLKEYCEQALKDIKEVK